MNLTGVSESAPGDGQAEGVDTHLVPDPQCFAAPANLEPGRWPLVLMVSFAQHTEVGILPLEQDHSRQKNTNSVPLLHSVAAGKRSDLGTLAKLLCTMHRKQRVFRLLFDYHTKPGSAETVLPAEDTAVPDNQESQYSLKVGRKSNLSE